MILAFFILGPFLLLLIAVVGYRYRAHQAEARANRAEGALDESRAEKTYLRNMAEKAIRLAAEAAHLDPDKVLRRESYDVEIREGDQVKQRYSASPPNYVPQIVANCTKCGVSVRHPKEAFPVPCPACNTLIDPVLDNPPEML